MTNRNLSLTILAIAFAFTGEVSLAAERSAADQALWAKANKVCNGPQYPSGARPVVNYSRGTYKCVETGSSRR